MQLYIEARNTSATFAGRRRIFILPLNFSLFFNQGTRRACISPLWIYIHFRDSHCGFRIFVREKYDREIGAKRRFRPWMLYGVGSKSEWHRKLFYRDRRWWWWFLDLVALRTTGSKTSPRSLVGKKERMKERKKEGISHGRPKSIVARRAYLN